MTELEDHSVSRSELDAFLDRILKKDSHATTISAESGCAFTVAVAGIVYAYAHYVREIAWWLSGVAALGAWVVALLFISILAVATASSSKLMKRQRQRFDSEHPVGSADRKAAIEVLSEAAKGQDSIAYKSRMVLMCVGENCLDNYDWSAVDGTPKPKPKPKLKSAPHPKPPPPPESAVEPEPSPARSRYIPLEPDPVDD